MIPTNCGNCVFWRKHPHALSNWGTCDKISVKVDEASKAHLTEGVIDTLQPQLRTRDTFFCAEWVYKQSAKQFTIVDAAREAAKRLKERTK